MLILLLNCLLAAVTSGGLENALDISTTGVIAQNVKMQVIAENIANVDTIKDETGNPYRAKKVIIKPAENFNNSGSGKNVLNGVQVVSIEEDPNPRYMKVYEPDHPEADEKGFVRYPDVNLTKELVDMGRSNGAFEANIVVFNATKSMMQASLEIGK